FSSRRRHTRFSRDWSSDVCSSDLTAELIERQESQALWREIRDCHPFADGTHAAVWRVSMAPTEGHKMVDAFRRAAGANAYYDWRSEERRVGKECRARWAGQTAKRQ